MYIIYSEPLADQWLLLSLPVFSTRYSLLRSSCIIEANLIFVYIQWDFRLSINFRITCWIQRETHSSM